MVVEVDELGLVARLAGSLEGGFREQARVAVPRGLELTTSTFMQRTP